MIISTMLNILSWFFSGLISLLPTGEPIGTSFTNATAWIAGLIGNLMYVSPAIGNLVIIFGLSLGVLTGVGIYLGINWIINKLRGSGS